jgi:F-type H+-transporting ATPase subunit delta
MSSQNQLISSNVQCFLDLGESYKVSIYEDLLNFYQLINHNNDLENLLYLPSFSIDEKIDVIQDVFMNLNISQLAKEIILFLLKEKRINLFSQIITQMTVIDDDRKGFMKASLYLSENYVIDSQQLQLMKSKLESRLQKKLQIQHEKKDNMTSGFVIRAGDYLFDASLENQLKTFQEGF